MRNTAKALLAAMVLGLAGAAALPAAAQGEYSLGEVRSVDKDKRQVVLKAGEVKNIDMPPMTMPFDVRDARLLEKFRPGDKVRFRAVNDAGKFTITEMLPAK